MSIRRNNKVSLHFSFNHIPIPLAHSLTPSFLTRQQERKCVCVYKAKIHQNEFFMTFHMNRSMFLDFCVFSDIHRIVYIAYNIIRSSYRYAARGDNLSASRQQLSKEAAKIRKSCSFILFFAYEKHKKNFFFPQKR